jgi:arabinogalactan endo-1,4-beta-galactosidase
MEFKNIRWSLILFLIFLLSFSCNEEFPYTPPETQVGLIKGADISLLQRIEDFGGVYKENSQVKDPLLIFSEHDFNCMRLRIFHTPSGMGPVVNDLPYTLALAKRVKNAHFKLLLDFHYSDTWADPAHQTKPAAWEGLSFGDLKDSLFEYTRSVITTLKNEGALPDIVQIGNEITTGFLWPDGKLPDNWDNFGILVNAGIEGVKAALESDDSVKIMIHVDNGANMSICQWFFDNLLSENVDFDIIGISYYPWWHGTLQSFENNLAFLSEEYEKDIMVVEVAYPWMGSYPPLSGSDFPDPPHEVSPQGQKEYLEELIRIIANTRNNRGKGIFYWAPEWIAIEEVGTNWGYLTLFDTSGEALVGMDAFLD